MDTNLKHSNITLKRITLENATSLFQLIQKNRRRLNEWFYWVEKTQMLEDTQKFIEEQTKKYKQGKTLLYGIWLDDELCGLVHLDHIDMQDKHASIGYWLDEDAEGKSVMFTACRLVITHAFYTLKLHRLNIFHHIDNTRSQNLILRLGFVKEGIKRESAILHGKFIDQVQYGLLDKEWIWNLN